MNLIILSGNLAKDAKLLSTAGGKSCCVATLAIREDMKPENKSATFIDLIIWGERAEKLYKHLTKGKAIAVTGRIEIIKNIKDNNTYISPRVVVNSLEFISKKTESQEKIYNEISNGASNINTTNSEIETEIDSIEPTNETQNIDDEEVPF